jgi:hypothetical protein
VEAFGDPVDKTISCCCVGLQLFRPSLQLSEAKVKLSDLYFLQQAYIADLQGDIHHK